MNFGVCGFDPNHGSLQKLPIPDGLMATILPQNWFLDKSESELESKREQLTQAGG